MAFKNGKLLKKKLKMGFEKAGEDIKMGAGELKQAIQQRIEEEKAMRLRAKQIEKGAFKRAKAIEQRAKIKEIYRQAKERGRWKAQPMGVKLKRLAENVGSGVSKMSAQMEKFGGEMQQPMPREPMPRRMIREKPVASKEPMSTLDLFGNSGMDLSLGFGKPPAKSKKKEMNWLSPNISFSNKKRMKIL